MNIYRKGNRNMSLKGLLKAKLFAAKNMAKQPPKTTVNTSVLTELITQKDKNKVWAFCAGQASDDFRGNPKYLFIYINKYRAFILPKSAIGEKYGTVKSIT